LIENRNEELIGYSLHALEQIKKRGLKQKSIEELKNEVRSGKAERKLALGGRRAIISGFAVYILDRNETTIITVMTLKEYKNQLF